MEQSEGPIVSLSKGLECIRKKRKVCKMNLDENIQNVIGILENYVEEISNTFEIEEDNQKLNRKVKDLTSQILEVKPLENVVASHKKYYMYASKFGKWTEKTLDKNINKIFNSKKLNNKALSKLIYQHFLQKGNLEVINELKREMNVICDSKIERKFRELHKIMEELAKHNLDPAIEWAQKHESFLEELGSDLLFLLYQQKFIYDISLKDKKKAVEFVRENFTRFFPRYTPQIQRLMGSLLYDERCENPRYADLFDQNKWEEISQKFFKEACKILEIPQNSPLSVTLEAGTLSLSQFLKFYSLSSLENWNFENEIPIPIEIGKDYKFHSFFVCPVGKELSTTANPPIALDCGHVVSTFAFKKLLSQNKSRQKCPYCPSLISQLGSKRIYFE